MIHERHAKQVDHEDRSAAGRNETGHPLRQDALEPGFHGVQPAWRTAPLGAELLHHLVRAVVRACSAAGLTADGDGTTRVAMLLEIALVVFLGPVKR